MLVGQGSTAEKLCSVIPRGRVLILVPGPILSLSCTSLEPTPAQLALHVLAVPVGRGRVTPPN